MAKTMNPDWHLELIEERALRVTKVDGKQRDQKTVSAIVEWIDEGIEFHLDQINEVNELPEDEQIRIGFGGCTELSILKDCCDFMLNDLIGELKDEKKHLNQFTLLGKDLTRADIFSYFAIMKVAEAREILDDLPQQGDLSSAVDAIIQAVDAVNIAERILSKGYVPDENIDIVREIRKSNTSYQNSIKRKDHPLKDEAIQLYKNLRKENPGITVKQAVKVIQPMLSTYADKHLIANISDNYNTTTLDKWFYDFEKQGKRLKRAKYE